MSKHVCIVCGTEENASLHVVSTLIDDDNGIERTVKELWCFSCVFEEQIKQYNEKQKKMHVTVRDTRFMSERDQQIYAFKPTLHIPEE